MLNELALFIACTDRLAADRCQSVVSEGVMAFESSHSLSVLSSSPLYHSRLGSQLSPSAWARTLAAAACGPPESWVVCELREGIAPPCCPPSSHRRRITHDPSPSTSGNIITIGLSTVGRVRSLAAWWWGGLMVKD